MALMSSPDPMPVDVISALPAPAPEVEVEVEAEELAAGDMAELIRSLSQAQVGQFIGKVFPDLSKRHTKCAAPAGSSDHPLRVAVDDGAGDPDAARQGGK